MENSKVDYIFYFCVKCSHLDIQAIDESCARRGREKSRQDGAEELIIIFRQKGKPFEWESK